MKRVSRKMFSSVLTLVGAFALGQVAEHPIAEAAAPAADIGVITYVKGDAQKQGGGASWSKLAQGSKLSRGDKLKTAADGRLEAKLSDGSMLRLAQGSELSLENVNFDKKNPAQKQVSAKLLVGRLWASVTKLFGNDSKFEVSTPNAVAGVRGTRFEASQSAAGETAVKVYSGQVLVSNKPVYAIKGHTKANRVQVAGPQEISKKAWEEMLAGAMQVVKVASNGAMSQPEAFTMVADPGDDWEAWNTERDQLAGIKE